ncbi:MAG: flippase [Bacteroidota bacterium]|nr:flippase [Bacteroidota bacterium]
MLKHTALNLSGLVVPFVVAAFAIPVTLHGYGPQRYGLLSLAISLLGSFIFLDMGTALGTVRFTAVALREGRSCDVPAICRSSVRMNAVLGIFFGLLFLAGGLTIGPAVAGVPPALEREARSMFVILAPAVPFVTIASAFRGVLEGCERFDLTNSVKIPTTMLLFLVPAAGAWLGFGIPTVMWLLLASRVFAALWFAACVVKLYPGVLALRTAGALSFTGPLLRFVGWVGISYALTPVLIHADKFLISGLLGVSFLAPYTAPYELISRVSAVPTSLAVSIYPKFSRERGAVSTGDDEKLFRVSLRALVMVYLPLCLGVILFARELVGTWLGPQYMEAGAPVLQILMLAFFFNALSHVPYVVVNGMGRPDVKAKLDLALAVFTVGCGWLMIRTVGISGAAAVRAAATAADFLVLFFFARRLMRARFAALAPRSVVLLGGLTATAGIAGLFVQGPAVLRAAYCGIVFSVAVFIYARYHYRDDARILADIVRRLRLPWVAE